MFLKNIKNIFKSNFPLLTNKIISFRDNNKWARFFYNTKNIDINKNIHGKKIVDIEDANKEKNIFLSYSYRPKLEKNTFKNITFENNSKNTAIIIQGPLANYENFVIETIKIYLKIFPEALIILSTWEDEIDKYFLKQTQNFDNFHLILNKKPVTKYNVNLQIISTYKAIDYAIQKNLKFSLKTRTDCRIYNPYSLIYLRSLLDTFKINKSNINYNRILSCSVDSRIFRVYGLSDICLFSETKDLSKYFINESYEESIKKLNLNIQSPIINETAVINEIFLCSRYILNLDLELKWTLDDWWIKCREIFCVFDRSSIDLFWYKYHWQYEQRFTNNYTSNYNQSLQFCDWLNLFNKQTEIYDQNNKEKWHVSNGTIEQKN